MTVWSTIQYVEVVEPIGDAFTDWEAYHAAWENQSTAIMPVGYQEEYRLRYWLPGSPTPSFYMQLSTPTFNPNATSVPAPTSLDLFTSGRSSIDVRTS